MTRPAGDLVRQANEPSSHPALTRSVSGRPVLHCRRPAHDGRQDGVGAGFGSIVPPARYRNSWAVSVADIVLPATSFNPVASSQPTTFPNGLTLSNPRRQAAHHPGGVRALPQMLLNFGRTRFLGKSSHEIGASWTPSSEMPAAPHRWS